LWQDSKGWEDFIDGHDLHNFVTRPELKAPKYMVAKHHPEAIAPGYWFVTPYTRLGRPASTQQKDYIPCTTGAHIYDGEGELVWSGACHYDNRIVFDLRPININDSTFLTFFLPGEKDLFNAPLRERVSTGVLMNSQYEEISRIGAADGAVVDGHEFSVLPGGKSTLLTTTRDDEAEAYVLGHGRTRKVLNTGFQEVDIGTAKALFEWDPVSHGVHLNESCDTTGLAPLAPADRNWDFFHINSVDKFSNGDYLVSSRHTSTIYRISRDDGHIVWRLGGCHNKTDFTMGDGVPFYWQHHARIRFENETHAIISVFDNASEDQDRGEPKGHNPPAGKILLLHLKSMTANMLRRFDRPDKGQSAALGSVSVLGPDPETANVFIDWAFDGYISEYDDQNRLALEAKFLSDRKRSYRAYKFPFKGEPVELPTLKIVPIGYRQDEAATAFYVSWNGATEVASWTLHGGDTDLAESFTLLATVKRRGFETSWVTPNLIRWAYAEARDANGTTIGRSAVAEITPSVDSRYKIAYPALQGVHTAIPLQDTPPTSSNEVGTHHQFDQEQHTIRAKSLYSAPSLLVYVFAAAGMYFTLRTVIQNITRRRTASPGLLT
jgi:hypothetical protein